MSLLVYFQVTNKRPCLPSPHGSLSRWIPSSCIEAANKQVAEIMVTNTNKRGLYKKYTPEEKTTVARYAVQHGTSAALRYFKDRFPELKWTTVNDWKEATKREAAKGELKKPVVLEEKNRGWPSLLSDDVTEDIKCYIHALRDAGRVVNTSIVLAAATGILQRKDPSSLQCNGGSVVLKKSWAKYLLKKMSFVKRKATTKSKVSCENFEKLREQYLFDIKVVVEMEEIPDSLIINWDQTGVNYVPVSEWTMSKEGSKRVEVVGVNDKRQITAVFGGTMSGDFLPVQLVYQGKTTKCLPTIDFPEHWHLTFSQNHWSNEETMINYVEKIFIPYVIDQRKKLGLDPAYPALAIFDEFNGQTTDAIFTRLENNNIFYVIVPPNCTDRWGGGGTTYNTNLK